MKTYFIRFCLILLLSQFNHLSISQVKIGLPLVKNYSPDVYDGGIQNWQIVQDERGVIYVANNFGLLQYDGNNWRVHHIDGISRLRSITLSESGRVYTGSQGDFGYFEGDSTGSLNYRSLKPLVPQEYQNIGETWKTYLINDKVYFCTFNFIYVYDTQSASIQVIDPDDPLDVSYTANNKLFSYINSKGLFQLEETQFAPKSFSSFFKNKLVSSVIPFGPNEMLFTTQRDGIYLYNGMDVIPWHPELNSIFQESFINCAIVLSNGNLVLGTQHHGIYIVNSFGEIELHMDKDEGLLSRTILSLFEDQNQNLWVGQNNGISFLQLKSPFRVINENSNLPGTGYAALQVDNDIFFGTNNGVYLKSGNEEPAIIEGTEGQVYGLQLIKNELYIGHNDGAIKIKDNRVLGVGQNRIGSWLFVEHNNHLLKGTYDGIRILDSDGNQDVGQIDNLNESSRIIVKENDTTLWMSHIYKGIFKLRFDKGEVEAKKVTYYNENNGLPTNDYNTVHLIEGELKISTEAGMFTYDESTDSFLPDERFNAFFKNDLITALKSDLYGNIYFITSESIGMLEKQGIGGYVKHTAPFNPIRHLLNDDLPNISILSPNVVLFGAKEGFVVFDRSLFWTTEQEKFKTMIRQVQNTGKETNVLYNGDYGQGMDLPKTEDDDYPRIAYDNNTIRFAFSSTSINLNVPAEFQYKLLGFDQEWQPWTETSFKEYTNLKEGFYTFQVRSRNANQIVSEIESYSFLVIYPWYRSPLANIIYILLAVSLIIGLIVGLDRSHQKEKNRLEQKREEEISQKEIQITKIAKTKEDEINQLQKEKLESEIKHMNTELATNTMHILNKNEFISGIKSSLGDVVKKSTNKEVQKQVSGLIKDIERNIQTDGDWKNFQIHFEKVHGDFSRRLKNQFKTLSPQEMKLSAYLRLNLSTKEIANLLNISPRGVEIGRYRLRKKLELTRDQNLVEFILNY